MDHIPSLERFLKAKGFFRAAEKTEIERKKGITEYNVCAEEKKDTFFSFFFRFSDPA